jgi:hypothetical protein
MDKSVDAMFGDLTKVASVLEEYEQAARDHAEWLTKEADSLATALRYFHRLGEMLDRIETARKRLSDTERALSYELIPAQMQAAGVSSITDAELGRRFGTSTRFSASILPETKPQAYDWLKDNGYENLIQPTVNSSALSAVAKSMIETDGVELPPELFKTSLMTLTTNTKVSGAKATTTPPTSARNPSPPSKVAAAAPRRASAPASEAPKGSRTGAPIKRGR